MSDNAKLIFAENLRYYLEQKELTQQDVANYMRCSNSTVSDWCSGKKYPRVDKMQRLADYLGMTMSQLTSPRDILDDVDIAFYGDYKELDERDKETLRDMVRIMRERRARREGNS